MRWPRRRTMAFGAVVALVGATAAFGLAVAPVGADQANAVQHRAPPATRHALDVTEDSYYCNSDFYGDRLAARRSAPQAVTGSSTDTPTRSSSPAKTENPAGTGSATRSNTPSRTDTATRTATTSPTATTSRTPTKTAADRSGTDTPAQTSTSTSTATDAPTETGAAAGPTGASSATGHSTDAAGLDAFRLAPLEEPSEDPSGDGTPTGTDTPVASPDTYSTPFNTALDDENVLGNDTNAESACLLEGPYNGTLTFNSDGTFTYEPDEGFVGSDTFTYEAVGSYYYETSNPAAVTIDVQPPEGVTLSPQDDTQPVDDSHTSTATVQDRNGTPIAGKKVTFTVTDGPNAGTSETDDTDSAGMATFTYTSEVVGTDTIVASIKDGDDTKPSNSTTVTWTPVANDDSYSARCAEPLTVSSDDGNGLLANDTPASGLNVDISSVTQPSTGTVEVQDDGSFTYTPSDSDDDCGTSTTFTYQATQDEIDSNPATVTINFISADLSIVKTAPTSVQAGADIQYTIDVSNSGPNPAANVTVTDPLPDNTTFVTSSNGCSYSSSEPGLVTCTAGTLADDGMASFTIDVTAPDDGSVTNTATVSSTTSDPDPENNSSTATTTITPAPQPPTAGGDAYTTHKDTPLTVPAPGVLANDSAQGGGQLHAVQVSNPAHGTVVLSSNGAVSYLPNAGFVGTDTFTYRASDGQQLSNLATVTISVTRTVTSPTSTPPSHPVTTHPTTPPPVTPPPVTQPPVTQPPVTQPPVTQPPVTTEPNTPAISTPASPGIPPDTTGPSSTTAPAQPTQEPSTPVTNPPASSGAQSLRLTAPSVIPGGPLRATGMGCAPNSSVQLTIAGRPAGSGTADAGGRFAVPVTTTGLKVGTYSVTAKCGDRQLVADVALVYVTANSNAPTAQALVVAAALAFFMLLLGLVIRRPTS